MYSTMTRYQMVGANPYVIHKSRGFGGKSMGINKHGGQLINIIYIINKNDNFLPRKPLDCMVLIALEKQEK